MVGLIANVVLVAAYSWLVATGVRDQSGVSSHSHSHVTVTQFLAGVLVFYLGGLLWSASLMGSMLVASRRCGRSAVFIIGRGPRLIGVSQGSSRLEWRLWPWGALFYVDEDAHVLAPAQEARILRAGLWSTPAAAALLALAALALPGRSWIIAVAAVAGAFWLATSLPTKKCTTFGGQLRLIQRYPEAAELREQARAALARREYDEALTLADRALAQPHSAPLAWQIHALAALAHTRAGDFTGAIRELEAGLEAAPGGRIAAVLRSNIADATFSEALRSQAVLPEAELDRLRAWAQARPGASVDLVKMAKLHTLAMLRLLEGCPDEAVSLCERAFNMHQAQPDPRSRPGWQVTAATLVIAYARSGRESEARELMAQLAPTGPLYDAAGRELGSTVDGSSPGA